MHRTERLFPRESGETLRELGAKIPLLDDAAMAAARVRQGSLTKPSGSLGRLEDLSIQLSGIAGSLSPSVARKAVIVMAGDHGVARRGVSAYLPEVTSQMVHNFLAGGAAVNVLARQAGARVRVVDVGVACELGTMSGLVNRKVAFGTADITMGPAMTASQAMRAIEAGLDSVTEEFDAGLDLLATGEMGIGNTTSSSAIIAAIGGLPAESVAGRGTGVDDEGLSRKIEAIETALALNQPDPTDPFDVLCKLGGLEIAGLVGVILGAALRRVPVLIDGFISGAAALIAAGLAPRVTAYVIAAHRSVEVGHRFILDRLGLRPLLDLDLQLGEGTGAVLAFHVIEASTRILNEMATFEEAGVSAKGS